jgi:pimeloyl-ACP methyl ester carboxylesterase
MMTARVAALGAIALAAIELVGLGGAPMASAAPTVCGDGVRRVSVATKGAPVLLVHGFGGAPSDFRRRPDGHLGMHLGMEGALRDLDGVVVSTFDYSAHSLEWVTDPDIGAALGRAVVCLAREQGMPVTIVAHSMGGLAARAAQGTVVDGRPVADSLGTVITVGTPFRGTQLLGFADGPAGDVFAGVLDTAGRACATDVGRRPRRSVCDLLGAANTAAVRAMIPGSDPLRNLPRWADGVRIVPMAADIEAGIEGPLGFSEQFSIGDFAVSVGSARADASPGTRVFVARCHASLLALVRAIDASPCSHANELANRRIIREVRDRVARAALRARSSARSVPLR